MRACGLDFGTSNTAAALPDGTVLSIASGTSEPRLFRSVLFFPEDERTVYAGAPAITRYLEDNAGRFIQSVKSFLHSRTFRATQVHGRTWTIEELVALLLRRVREAAGAQVGSPPESVTLGRPALFSSEPEADALAEQRLRKAAELAGFTHIQFLIEPIAAALAYEAQLSRDELVLVADFGAGTTDLTLMRLGPSRRGKPDRRRGRGGLHRRAHRRRPVRRGDHAPQAAAALRSGHHVQGRGLHGQAAAGAPARDGQAAVLARDVLHPREVHPGAAGADARVQRQATRRPRRCTIW